MRVSVYIAACIVVLSACNGEKQTDWARYYESQHKTPFGTNIFKEELEEMFSYTSVEEIKKQTPEYFEMYSDVGETFLYINQWYYPDSATTHQLLDFTAMGNSLFIATSFTENSYYNLFDRDTSVYRGNEMCRLFDLEVSSLKHTKELPLSLHYLSEGDEDFTIQLRDSFVPYFSKIPLNAKILGTVKIAGISYPNFLSLNLFNGQGKVFLHANPVLFTNYHMLNEGDGLYAKSTLSYLNRTDYFLWDGFGTKRRYTTPPSDGSSSHLLRYILKNKSLFYGFLALIVAMGLFLIFNYKRVSRSIPLHQPKNNKSLEFMKMIANLFVSEENHIDLAKYRIIFLLDNIRAKYYLDTSELDEEFISKLAEKTTMSIDEISPFVKQINRVRSSNYLHKGNFLKFSKLLESFNTKLDLNKWNK